MSLLIPFTSLDLAVFVLCTTLLFWISSFHTAHSSSPFPPGPRGWPLIGNLFDFPYENYGERLALLSRKHGMFLLDLFVKLLKLSVFSFTGDFFCLRIMGKIVIVISSVRIAKDLLEKRAPNWSERPMIPLLHLCVCFYLAYIFVFSFIMSVDIHRMEVDSWNMSIMPHTKDHKAQRRIADQYLRPSALITYRSMLRSRTYELLRSIVRTPEDFRYHIR